jgi:hypothetical protein
LTASTEAHECLLSVWLTLLGLLRGSSTGCCSKPVEGSLVLAVKFSLMVAHADFFLLWLPLCVSFIPSICRMLLVAVSLRSCVLCSSVLVFSGLGQWLVSFPARGSSSVSVLVSSFLVLVFSWLCLHSFPVLTRPVWF